MSQDIKQILREEYVKCATDPIYFMKKYCYIQHPQRGRIQFQLYPFQEKVLKLFQDNPYSIILKSRQLGISTLGSGYSLWLMLFFENKNVLALATTQATARNLVSKVQFMYENLPSWLKIGHEENNKLSLKLTNGSKIQAKSSSPDAARSEAVSLLVVDEAAFIDNIAETWASAQQTLATGGGAIVLSTPYGTGNWFHKMWEDAENSLESAFLPIRLPWQVHPERDQSWRDKQDTLLGDPRLAAQECDCDFNTSGDTVFYSEFMDFYKKTYVKDPLEKRGTDRNLWIWEPADYSRSYMVIADVARGDSKDYSAFHIMDIETNTQVGEYKGQIGTQEYGHLLVGVATEYNNALLVIENANIGWSTIQTVIERGYQNFYHSPKSGEIKADSYFNEYSDTSKMVPGFTMNSRTRPICINKFQEAIADKGTIIQSNRLLSEMKTFVWKNGRAEAQSGFNDDLVISFATGQYVRSTALQFSKYGEDMYKSMLNATSTTNTPYYGGYSGTSQKDQWKMDNPYSNGEEDIKWLL
tara:strand:+ start:2224 stop:3804 length:1581 start_codon:yes stop_codon:yes gene_type:complete